jgi:hypothetical protein
MAATNVQIEKDNRGHVTRASGFGAPTFTDVPAGTRFKDLTTGAEYVFDGSRWDVAFEVPTGVATGSLKSIEVEADFTGSSETITFTSALPARSVIVGLVFRVLTTLTGTSLAKVAVGVSGTLGKFTAAVAAILADKAVIGKTAPFVQEAAANVLATAYQSDGSTTVALTAGRARVTVFYYALDAGASASYVASA